MMFARRSVMFLLAALAVAAPASAATNWAKTVAATPEGGIRIGNPAAKVKIIEFASYTCSHCKVFNETGVPALKAKYIASGAVSIEQRSFVRNGPDMAASLLMACLAPVPALSFADALFAEQAQWTQPFTSLSEADSKSVADAPVAQQPARLAAVSGLDRWAVTKGVPLAKGQACLASSKAQDRLLATRSEALTRYKLEGTPTFVINGAMQAEVYDWASLEPRVQAALK